MELIAGSGRPGISPAVIVVEVKKLGVEPMIHDTLKDKNRLAVECGFYGFDRDNLHDLRSTGCTIPEKLYGEITVE